MMSRIAIAAAVLSITALGYLLFPAHTWLQEDTQIYVPILEHRWDADLLANDPVATKPHVGYTVYDELVLGARRLTGAGFHAIMAADQIVFRAVGILGVFLIATSLGLSTRLALLVAGVYALGATVTGPSVLTVEYEPKPRGSAIGMILLAIGLLGMGRVGQALPPANSESRRYLAAGVVAALATLYHPPTACPFWLVMGAWALWPWAKSSERRPRLFALIPLLVAGVVLYLIAHIQAGGPEPQSWFATLSPELEHLQRLRADYNWVSNWINPWGWHYATLLALAGLALYRLRAAVNPPLRFALAGLPIVGALSVLLAWLTYDIGKWSLMAKFQPARAVLWIPAIAVILAATVCLHAARGGRRVESVAWGVAAFMIPVQHNVWNLLWPDFSDPLIPPRLGLAAGLALVLAAAGWLASRRTAGWAVWAVALVLPFIALPKVGQVETEPDRHHATLDELAVWARGSTDRDAVFLFPDVGHGRQPGIFRAEALRAVYVDWKSGGQVNMVQSFARQWWERYSTTMLEPFEPDKLPRYASLGIDYVVLGSEGPRPDRTPLFSNSDYAVFRTSLPDGGGPSPATQSSSDR